MSQQTQIQQQPAQALQARPALDFIPANIDEAWRHSELYARAGIIPDALKGKPHDVLICLLTGAELGISPMQALREVYVIKGKTFIASALRVAIVRQSKECLAWQLVESTPEKATYRTQRRGDAAPTTMTFTMREAEVAGLPAQNSKYKTDGALMLRRRCASRLIDEVYPDVIRGVADDVSAEDVVEGAAEVKATGPARVTPIRISSTSAPAVPEPRQVEDAQEVTPPPSPALQVEQQPETQQTPSGEPTLYEVLMSEIEGSTTEKDLDAITARAQRDMPKGPERQAVGKAISARRADIKGAR